MSLPADTTLRDALVVSLEAASTIGPDVLRGAWAVATKTKDIELLALTARRPELPADVVTAAVARTEMPIRIAYLARPTTSTRELTGLLKNEQRAGVLAGVCSEIGFAGNPALLTALEDRMREKPTRTLAEAIVAQNGGTATLYAHAMIELSSRRDITAETATRLQQHAGVVCVDPAAASMLLSAVSLRGAHIPSWMEQVVAAPGVDCQARMRVVTEVIEVLADRIKTLHANGPVSPRVLRHFNGELNPLLSAPDLQEPVLEALAQIALELDGGNPAMAAKLTAYDPEARRTAAAAREDLLDRLRQTSDMRTLAALVGTVDGKDLQAQNALRENPALAGEPLDRAVCHLAAKDAAKAVEFAAKHPGTRPLLLVYAVSPAEAARSDEWRCFVDPAAAKRELIELIVQWPAGQGWGPSGVFALERLVDALPDGDPALGAVPWSAVTQMVNGFNRHSRAAARVCAYLAQGQQNALGADMDKWETLTVLSAGFAGTIDQLLAAAATL